MNSSEQSPTTENTDIVPFLSLASLRDTHRGLIEERRKNEPTPEFWDKVMEFLLRGQAGGAYLDIEDERITAQNLLDYWENLLYHEGLTPPEAILADFDPTQFPEIPDHLCPYVGLTAFREDNKHLFYGRSHLIEDLLRHVLVNQLIAVVGPSGSGKSSVILAGLLPRLQNDALPGSRNWHYFDPIVPGSAPLIRLANLLKPEDVAAENWVPEQIEKLQGDHTYLTTLVNNTTSNPAVFVIDQFEETFTLCQDEKERMAFINNLLNLVQSRSPRHLVILTMRTDYESYLEKVTFFKSMFEQGEVRISAMNGIELREAIEKPAESVGLKFEEGLVDRLVREILGEPAALPLLQFALLQLWDNRERNRVTWESYRRVGSVMEALANTADTIYESLLPEEQVTARRIMMQIVHPTEGLEVTRNRVRREMLYRTGEASDRIDRVLEKLVQARLVILTEGETPEDDQVEVAHEALVRNWPRLIEWLDDERVVLRRRHRLTVQAEQWDARGRQKDDIVLLRGWLLEEAKNFADLGPVEEAFVEASQTAVDKAARDEEDRRQRELKLAQELVERANQIAEEQKAKAKAEARSKEQAEILAATEKNKAEVQRRFLIALAVLFIITVSGLIFSYNTNKVRLTLERDAALAEGTILAQAIMEETLIAEQRQLALEQSTTDAQIATTQAEQTVSAIEQATVTVQIAQSQAEASTRSVLDATEAAQDAEATSTAQFQSVAADATRDARATATAAALNPVVRTPTLQPTAVIGQFLQAAQLNGFLREKDSMPVLFVTGSQFEMGPPDSTRQVEVEDFYIDQYEVTVRQFATFLNELGGYEGLCSKGFDCAFTGFETQYTHLLNNFGILEPKAGFETYPVNWVSWYGAQAYCQWVGGDLPTAEQWEYVARAIDGRTYPWGDGNPTSRLAVYGGSVNSFSTKLKAVDALLDGASPFGALNMAGSMREWLLDTDLEDENYRLLRGGSWTSSTDKITTYAQTSLPADIQARNITSLDYWDAGFRCAMPTTAKQ
jgi:formylglycine-generating enzyme required for sulfatase activity/energy-coupling factor transporter ATP-binding protein EcfA2